MKALQNILDEITKITLELETNYPELYKHITEMPVRFDEEGEPTVSNEEVIQYLESLKLLLQHHLETHPKQT